MSEHMFGVSRKKPSRADAKRMDRIARKHDCALIEVTLPGTGYQRWFVGPNRGSPFDQQMADAVYADLDAAGLGAE